MAETKIPSIYRIPSNVDPELKHYLESVQEAVEVRLGRRGDELDQAVTYRDLIDSNLAQKASRLNRVIEPLVEEPTPSMPFNTTPQNVKASGIFTKIMVTWDDHQMGSLFARAEVWRAGVDDLNAAQLQTSVYGSVWTDTVDYNTTMYYWVRFIQRPTSVSGNETFGAFSSPAASATTSADIEAVMTALSEDLADLPGYGTLINTTVPNLISTNTASLTKIIKNDSEPSTREDSSALQAQDIWIDTNDNNQMYVRNSANNAWVEARDGTLVALVGATSFTGSTISGAMATAQQNIITVTGAQSSTATDVTNLTSTVTTKARTFIHGSSSNLPAATAVGDILIRTDENNKMYRATAANNSSWVAIRDTANDNYPRIFTATSAPTAVNTGDIWFDTDSTPANKQYRWDGSNWVAVRDLVTQANLDQEATTRANADTAESDARILLQATVNAKTQTFAQDGVPTSVSAGDLWIDTNDSNKMYRANFAAVSAVVTSGNGWYALPTSTLKTFAQDGVPTSLNIGDLWIDTNDSNKMYRANAVGVSAIVTSGNGWYLLDDDRIESSADAIEVLNTSVGLSGAEATKITALEASIGKVYGARVITTNTSNNVKVETMANSAGSTTTATHGISDSDVTAGVFLSLKNAVATGGITTTQLNKTFKVTARVNTTQLQIAVVGDAATSTATSTTVVDGGTIGANAGLAQLATVTADIEGNAHSSYVLQVSANGSVAGMVIEANAEAGGTASAVQFVADKFAIWNSQASPAAGTAPFVVTGATTLNGETVPAGVYMEAAFIKNGAITNAKIGDAEIETAKIVDLNADKIRTGTLDSSVKIKVGNSGDGATHQRIEISAVSNYILIVDDSTP